MAQRKDGIATRERLLEAGCKLFSEKGLRDTTIAEICALAGANVAAVNYYFGSKQELYAQAWRDAFDYAARVYPVDGGLDENARPEDRLRALIRSFLFKVLDTGPLGHAGKFLLREMSQPSEISEQVRQEAIEPIRRYAMGVIRELLGPGADPKDVSFCTFSVVSQCMVLGFRGGKLPPVFQQRQVDRPFIDELADHIARLSLDGIHGIARQVKDRETTSTGHRELRA